MTAHTTLFPLFAQRVMRPSRPDFDRYRRALGLDVDTSDWSILGRSQGQREGDGICVFPEPDVDEAGGTSPTFFVSGLSDRMRQDPQVAPALARLAVGDRLRLLHERATVEHARAVLVVEQMGVALAWLPGLLLSHLDTISSGGAPELTVVGTQRRRRAIGIPAARHAAWDRARWLPALRRPRVVAGAEAPAV